MRRLGQRCIRVAERDVTVTLMHPQRDTESGDFTCLGVIEGLESNRIELTAGGVDEIQAVTLCLVLLGQRIDSAPGVKSWLGLPSTGLPTFVDNRTGDVVAEFRMPMTL